MISVNSYRRQAIGMILSALLCSPIARAETLAGSVSNDIATKGRSLTVREKDGVGIQVAQSNGSDYISIELAKENPKYEVTKLANPPRLVVDLKSNKIRANKNLAIADLEHVSSIRLGSHATSGRIVLDLAEGSPISHQVQVNGSSIVLSLSAAGASAQNVSAVVEPRLPDVDEASISKPRDASEKAATHALPNKPEIVIENAVDTTDAPTLRGAREIAIADGQSSEGDVSVVPVSATTSKSSAHVKSVKLNASEGSLSALTLDVDGKPEFSISRTAPSEYVLTLKDTSLSDSVLSSTLFSESKTAGIRSVRSSTSGRDALIRIFAQPEAYLTARLAGTRVVVEETADMQQVVDDMRAQLAPKDTSAKDKDGAKKKDAAPSKSAPASKDVKAGKDAPTAKPADSSVAAKVEPASQVSNDTGEMSDSEVQSLLGDTARYTGKLISLDLQDTDIDNALRIIAEVSNLNIVASEDVVGKVTLRLTDVPWDQALDVILKTHGLDKVLEGNVMRIAPVDKLRVERESLKQAQVAEAELEPLSVRYMRVSYGRASELKSLAEAVLSERGSVAYDERSNQLIVKDISSGLKNVTELVSKVDLRTPQVLLETQIVEASRNLSRQLGSELGFQYIQSPATGNGTGLNFPAAISIGGSAITQAAGTATGGATSGAAAAVSNVANITGSAFPVASSAIEGSALTMLFDSADGTKTLELRLSQLEQEGRVRIVSRPAVATTNNKPAEIKSVEKYRVKLPNGGTSVATGAGASAAGSGGNATEVIEAGIVLNVTPQASPDYYILLDIKAKSSSFGSNRVDGIPNEIERSASSSVLVSSGQTFALGGIYKINEADTVTGVPFFKDIPFLGTFFRRSQTDNSDEELLFFITPRIVEGSFDDATMKAAS